MPVTIQFVKSRNLVYVRYGEYGDVVDSFEQFSAFLQHPDFRPGQNFLIDLSWVKDFDRVSPTHLMHQALMADVFASDHRKPMVVFYAPTRISQEMAMVAARPWDRLNSIIPVILQNEIDVLELLGVSEPSVEALLKEHS